MYSKSANLVAVNILAFMNWYFVWTDTQNFITPAILKHSIQFYNICINTQNSIVKQTVMEFSLYTHTFLSHFYNINCCECLKLTFLLVFTQVKPLTHYSEIDSVTQPVKKFLTILWNLRFITMFITAATGRDLDGWVMYATTLAIHCPRFLHSFAFNKKNSPCPQYYYFKDFSKTLEVINYRRHKVWSTI
jgi:hypothetical protein